MCSTINAAAAGGKTNLSFVDYPGICPTQITHTTIRTLLLHIGLQVMEFGLQGPGMDPAEQWAGRDTARH